MNGWLLQWEPRFVEWLAAAVRDALLGGTDSNCGCYFDKYLTEAITTGVIGEATINLAAGRIIHAMIKLGPEAFCCP